MAVCGALAKPGVPLAAAPLAYTAPIGLAAPYAATYAAPGVVTAQSSQVISRNYNGIAAPLAYTAPVAAPVAYSAPLGYAAPLTAAATPLGYSAYAAAPLGYSAYSPYTAAAPLVL